MLEQNDLLERLCHTSYSSVLGVPMLHRYRCWYVTRVGDAGPMLRPHGLHQVYLDGLYSPYGVSASKVVRSLSPPLEKTRVYCNNVLTESGLSATGSPVFHRNGKEPGSLFRTEASMAGVGI